MLLVVLDRMNGDMVIGCPTLDKLQYYGTREDITLNVYDITFPRYTKMYAGWKNTLTNLRQ